MVGGILWIMAQMVKGAEMAAISARKAGRSLDATLLRSQYIKNGLRQLPAIEQAMAPVAAGG